MLELNKIYNMDCLDGMKPLLNNSVDLILTDPPYQFGIGTMLNPVGGGFMKHQKKKYLLNIEKSFGFNYNPSLFLSEAKRVLKKFNLVIWTNKLLLKKYLTFAEENNFYYELLIWSKPNPVPINNNHFLNDKEFAVNIRERGAYFNSS